MPHVLAIAICVIAVTVCERITYELPNVLDTNLTLKMEVKDVDDLDENVHGKVPQITTKTNVKLCNKSNSTAGAVQVEANMQKQLNDHLHSRKLKCC